MINWCAQKASLSTHPFLRIYGRGRGTRSANLRRRRIRAPDVPIGGGIGAPLATNGFSAVVAGKMVGNDIKSPYFIDIIK